MIRTPGMTGTPGEVSRELRLVGSDVLERNHAAGLRVEFDDAVDEKERITVRKHVHDVTDVERTHIGT